MYSPSKGTIANVVQRDLAHIFKVATVEMLRSE